MTSAVCIPHVDGPIAPAGSAPPDRHAGARTMPIRVTGPDNRMLDARWLLLPDGTGLVDLASTGGSGAGRRPRPLTAHSRGFGQAVAAALDHGVDRLILTLGESCCADGGVGALRELGAAFLDQQDRPVTDGGAGLADLAVIDLSGIRGLPPGGVVVLSDLTQPLVGRSGAAHTLARRGGASAVDVAMIERGLRRLAAFELLPHRGARPAHTIQGTGAGGGLGYALRVWSAHAPPGHSR